MDDAKRKKMLETPTIRWAELLRRFEQLGINAATPSFYDDSEFMAEERQASLKSVRNG